jgi:uncharacterized protein (TIGR03083 family)
MSTADARVEALRASVTRLHDIASTFTEAELTSRAYPSEWTVADVLSHIGSGAVIMLRRLEDTLAGQPTPDEHAPGVWDEWNAKSPTAQRDEALQADAELLSRIEAVTPDQRSGFAFAMGPMSLDFEGFVGLRLNEHAFHTWDVEVIRDPAAALPPQQAEQLVDNLQMIAQFTGKPTGEAATITVAVTDPERGFTIELTPDAVGFTPGPVSPSADLRLPAEAFARLVYGRLDPAHTPAGAEGPALDTLRQVFPGF